MGAAPSWAIGSKREGEEVDIIAKKAKQGDVGSLRNMVRQLAKLVLQNSNTLREVMGTLWTTYDLKLELEVVKLVKATNKRYFDLTKYQPGHDQGPPFLHTWVSLVQGLGQEEGVPQNAKKVLVAYWNQKYAKWNGSS